MNEVSTESGICTYDRNSLVVEPYDKNYQPLQGATKILSIQEFGYETVVSYDNGVVWFPKGKVFPPTKIVDLLGFDKSLAMIGINPLTIIIGDEIFTSNINLADYHPIYNEVFAPNSTFSALCYKLTSNDMKTGVQVYFDLTTKSITLEPYAIEHNNEQIIKILEGNRFIYGYDGNTLYQIKNDKIVRCTSAPQNIVSCRVSDDTIVADVRTILLPDDLI